MPSKSEAARDVPRLGQLVDRRPRAAIRRELASSRHMTRPKTTTLTSDFAASTRLAGATKRAMPRAGLTRPRLGARAWTLRIKPLCTSVEAITAAATAASTGKVNVAAEVPASRSTSATPRSERSARPLIAMMPRRVLRSGTPSQENTAETAAMPAIRPARLDTSREIATFPSSLARCSRLGVAASVRSPLDASSPATEQTRQS